MCSMQVFEGSSLQVAGVLAAFKLAQDSSHSAPAKKEDQRRLHYSTAMLHFELRALGGNISDPKTTRKSRKSIPKSGRSVDKSWGFLQCNIAATQSTIQYSLCFSFAHRGPFGPLVKGKTDAVLHGFCGPCTVV